MQRTGRPVEWPPMRFTLPTGPDFDFCSAICSHGFFMLAPNRWDPATRTLSTAVALNDETAVELRITAEKREVNIDVPHRLTARQRAMAGDAVRRMLRLDEDLASFHERCRQSPTHARAAETRFGRLIRSATLFEDIVKVICTCNVTWRQTVTMVEALVRRWGVPAMYGTAKAFPTAARLANVPVPTLRRSGKVGYRANYIGRLARETASGERALGAFEYGALPAEYLNEALQELPGVGPYGAANLCMLLGRYDFLAVDTEMKRFFDERYPGREWTPEAMREHYADWHPYPFLAYWYELWQGYTQRHGESTDWQPDATGRAITSR